MITEQLKAWLGALKVGDKVATRRRGEHFIRTVTKVTPRQIVTNNGGRYRRDNGRSIGETSFTAEWLYPVTDEISAEVEHRTLSARLSAMDWSHIPRPTLRAVMALVVRAQSGHE